MADPVFEVIQLDRKLGYDGPTNEPPHPASRYSMQGRPRIPGGLSSSGTDDTKGTTDEPGFRKSFTDQPNPTFRSASLIAYDEQQLGSTVARSWAGVAEIMLNLLGSIGFVVGSTLWLVKEEIIGSIVFGIACIFSGIAQAIYGCKFFIKNDFIGVYVALQNGFGCVAFIIGSFLFPFPGFMTLCLITYLGGSILFLTGCLLAQFQQQLWLGLLAPVVPNTPKIIPTGLLNTVGSVLFVLGSVFLFFDWGQAVGSWCYEIGSIIFFLASWGDAILWCSADQEPKTWEDYYAAVLHSPSKMLENSSGRFLPI